MAFSWVEGGGRPGVKGQVNQCMTRRIEGHFQVRVLKFTVTLDGEQALRQIDASGISPMAWEIFSEDIVGLNGKPIISGHACVRNSPFPAQNDAKLKPDFFLPEVNHRDVNKTVGKLKIRGSS
ncbi:uncharacterized protein LOC135160757 isoform X2 [Diachasmimorpha longicaudata]|uniref:uncharacterized protein LOC135160757 isoform X2 n=1 Tax=Diachasmimorpha longicaudata TaxID=58733 RepID=UPI0030B87D6F